MTFIYMYLGFVPCVNWLRPERSGPHIVDISVCISLIENIVFWMQNVPVDHNDDNNAPIT